MLKMNKNSERTLIGQILTDNKIFHSLKITEDDITHLENKRIFKAITACINKGLVADIVTISDYDNNIPPSQLATITSSVASTANWEYYHNEIIQNSYKQKLVKLSLQLQDWVKTMSPDETVKNIEEALMEITKKTGKNKVLKIDEIASKFIQTIEERYHKQGEPLGIQTGIEKLDEMIIGFRDRLFYLVGGRPSQGKSALLLNFACHAGIRLNKVIGYISTESSVMEIITRLFASEGKVNSMNLITGFLTPQSFPKMINVAERVYDKHMYFYYTPGMTLDNVAQTARLMVRYYGCEIIYIDYLQDIVVENNDPLHIQTMRKSKTLKYLAEELDIPIVAGAQLRRDSEERRPRLSDFSDSSQLEKDADGAILIYHHHINRKESEEEPQYRSFLLAEKTRDGMTGQIPVHFTREYVTFNQRISGDE